MFNKCRNKVIINTNAKFQITTVSEDSFTWSNSISIIDLILDHKKATICQLKAADAIAQESVNVSLSAGRAEQTERAFLSEQCSGGITVH